MLECEIVDKEITLFLRFIGKLPKLIGVGEKFLFCCVMGF